PAMRLSTRVPSAHLNLFPYTTLFRSAVCCVYARNGIPGTRRGPETWSAGRVEAEILEPGGHATPPYSDRRAARRHRECGGGTVRSEEHTSELQSLRHLVCRLLLEKKN